jgi:hypothetical protein
MDIVELVALHRIQTAIEEGLFENLPARGEIDCSLRGEAFLTWWLRTHHFHEAEGSGGGD